MSIRLRPDPSESYRATRALAEEADRAEADRIAAERAAREADHAEIIRAARSIARMPAPEPAAPPPAPAPARAEPWTFDDPTVRALAELGRRKPGTGHLDHLRI